MTVSSWPYVAQDTTDIEYGYLFREFSTDGVVGSIGDTILKPFADSTGLQVKLPSGSAILRGYMVRSTAQEIIPLATAPDPAQPRVDRLVAELNLSAPTIPERIKFKMVSGTAGSATPPALVTSDTGVHQLSLGLVSVAAGATTIAAAAVSDDRSFVSNEVGAWTGDSKRPTNPRKSQVGWNETRGYFEYWNGTAWSPIADWASLSGKPATFPPSTHTHTIAQVTGLQAALDDKAPLASPTFTGTITGNLVGEVNGIRFWSQAATPTTPTPQDGDVWFSA